jgi:hypothetical protein
MLTKDIRITPMCTMSTNSIDPLHCNIPFRARLARFDRPAKSLSELLHAEGDDFIHLAAWTVLGRRAAQEEHTDWCAFLASCSEDPKGSVIAQLAMQAEISGSPPPLMELRHYLRIRARRNIPVVGRFAATVTHFYLCHPALGIPTRFLRKIPGKCRWTYRHSRKGMIKIAKWINLPAPAKMRRTLGAMRQPAPEAIDPRAAEYYRALCIAVDAKGSTN